MKVTMVLADFARVADNKLDLLGAGWDLRPAEPTPAAIGLIVEVPWAQRGQPHTAMLELRDGESGAAVIDPAGQPVARVDVEFGDERPAGVLLGTANIFKIPILIPPIELQPSSRYKWVLSVDGHSDPEWEASFSTAARRRAA